MTKYVEEFCPVDGYRCLMPVEYESVSKGAARSTYKKVRCNCYHVREGKCENGNTCKHFIVAEEIIEE